MSFVSTLARRVGGRLNAVSALIVSMFVALVVMALPAAAAGTPSTAWGQTVDTSMTTGETDLTSLVTNHLPYMVGAFVALLALSFITVKLSRTIRGGGKRV